ncbi:MAG: hypothetical protein ABS876_01360 [Ruminococcus sp.]
MTFPNGADGVKKIFTAEILGLIASVCFFITAILTITTVAAAVGASGGSDAAAVGAVASGAGVVVLSLGGLVLSIISFILSLVGINKASKDEPSFKMALYAIFAGIALAVLAGVFSGNSVVNGIIQALQVIAEVVVTLYVIQGIRVFAQKLNNAEVDKKGETLFKIIMVVLALEFIARIIVAIFGGSAASVTAGIFALVAVVLSIVQYILYLSLLAKAKKMLAES